MSWSRKKQSPEKPKPDSSNYSEQFTWEINATTNEAFASRLERKLKERLLEHENSERKSRKETFTIFSQCFEEIIRQHTSFAPLLSDIKHEYENCIETVFRGEKEAAYLYRNLTTGISGLRTLENYRQRIEDLKKKIKIIREDNTTLKEKSSEPIKKQFPENGFNVVRQELERKISLLRSASYARKPSKDACEFGKFRIKVLERYSTSEQLNITFLRRELRRLQKEIEELVRFFDKRFKSRETKERLIEKLLEKERLKTELQETCKELKIKLLKLEERIKEERKHRDLVMAKKPTTIVELILLALKHGENDDDFIEELEDELTADTDEEENMEEDLCTEQEQEEMVEYMDKFEQLFKQGFYEEAAIVAATSPQDILRTATTFQRFKEQPRSPGEKSPLLFYCEAVMVNCASPGQKGLTASESAEAVERALEEGRKDLLLQWLSQNKLRYSDALGDTIIGFCACDKVCICGCYTLAESVYRKTKAHGKVVTSLCRQGRLHMAVNHARNVGKFRKLEFMQILQDYPSFEHAMVLLQVGDGYLSSPLCREECITALVRADKPEEATRLLLNAQDGIQCSKLIAFVEQDRIELWMRFIATLEKQGFVNAARDVASALILAGVFYVARLKLAL